MKTSQGTIYTAFDGKQFLTEAECKAYEEDNWLAQFIGLTSEQVLAAYAMTDSDLADAFIKLGQRLARRRLEAGDRRRTYTPRNGGKTQADADEEAHERAEDGRSNAERFPVPYDATEASA